MNGRGGCVPINFKLWTHTFEFHVIFTCHEILYSFYFFQLLKKGTATGQPDGSVG